MWLFEWWGGLSPGIRVIVSFVFLLISTVLWFCGYFWPWGWGIGIVLLLFSFPSQSEKKGYHDF
jgi:hypothetical protein